MRRKFNSGEKIALYLAAGGKCQGCGAELMEGWHADHREPFSAGGSTTIENGQALCPACNQRKGASMIASYNDNVQYRPWQKRFREAALSRLDAGERSMVGNIAPGSGKTLAALDLANELYRRGLIDAVAVFVPRLNLATQYELDWVTIQKFYDPAKRMGKICARGNKPPLLRDGAFGYITTYSSLIAKPQLHFEFFRARRVLCIYDEAQQLGSEDDGDGTESGRIAKDLGKSAFFTVVKSGTPLRPDGRPLIFAQYSAPDEAGKVYLLADVEAHYLEGVAEGYLLPFEAILGEGQALREYLDGEPEQVTVSSLNAGLSEILEAPGFWRPMVDKTIEKVREVQAIHPSFSGLIAARRQSHARAIKDYLDKKGVRSLIAVSDDGDEAKMNLEQFKTGSYDILITVAMAHVGYDHKPITVVCCLNAVRETGWLDQLIARGMRVWSEVPLEDQICYLVAPNDRQMVAYADEKRRISDAGILQRTPRDATARNAATPNLPLSFISSAQVTGWEGKGMDPDNDLASPAYAAVEGIRQEYRLGPCSTVQLGRLLKDHGVLFEATVAIKEPDVLIAPRKTEGQRESEERKQIADIARKSDFRLMNLSSQAAHGDTYGEIYSRFYRGAWTGSYKNSKLIETFSLSELTTIRKWLTDEYFPAIDKKWRDHGSPSHRRS